MTDNTSPLRSIDHIAIAVIDIEQAIEFFCGKLGFVLKRRLHIKGKRTGMLSAEVETGGLKFVICQGTERDSQVSRLVEDYGPGVSHIAMRVDSVTEAAELFSARGLEFDTNVISETGLTQIFSRRCTNTGMTIELIHRDGEEGFLEDSVQQLFEQLEAADKY